MHVSRRHAAPAGQRHQPPERPGGAAIPEHQVPPQDGQQGGGQEGQHPVQAHGLQQPHGPFTLLARETFFTSFVFPTWTPVERCYAIIYPKKEPRSQQRQNVWPSVHKWIGSLCSCKQAVFSNPPHLPGDPRFFFFITRQITRLNSSLNKRMNK